MRIFRYILVSLVIAMAAFAAAQDGQPFRLVFANATLSSVLRAVGLRTGANIVYVGKEDPPVTIDVTAGNADEARAAMSEHLILAERSLALEESTNGKRANHDASTKGKSPSKSSKSK